MPSRLGDDIDDFCVKCKRLTNHSVVSLWEDKPAKVRCRTCYHDHDFRNEEPLPSKKDLKKAALFAEVLAAKGAVELDVADSVQDNLEEEEEGGPDGGSAATPAVEPVEPEAAEEDVPPVAAMKKATVKKNAAKKAAANKKTGK